MEVTTWLGWGFAGLSAVAAFAVFLRSVRESPILFWTLAIALLPLGAVLGSSFKTVSSLGTIDIAVLVVVAFSSLFAGRQFHQAYEYFGNEFAATVYRDFYVLNQMATSERRR